VACPKVSAADQTYPDFGECSLASRSVIHDAIYLRSLTVEVRSKVYMGGTTSDYSSFLHTVFSILLSLASSPYRAGSWYTFFTDSIYHTVALSFRHDTYNRNYYIPIIYTKCLLNYYLFSHSWLRPMPSSSCSKRSCKPLGWTRK